MICRFVLTTSKGWVTKHEKAPAAIPEKNDLIGSDPVAISFDIFSYKNQIYNLGMVTIHLR